MKKNIILFLPIIFITLAFNYLEPRLDNLVSQFDKYFQKNKSFKIYIHNNKDDYKANETIWFKAYLVNSKNIPDTLNENLYVELINSENKIVYVRLLKLKNGTAHGDFFISDSLQNGYYQIRAYINFMKNYDTDYFFTKTIFIDNPNNTYISEIQYHKAKKASKINNDFEVDFFPESGNFIYNIKSKVSFLALNNRGKSIVIKGNIFDNKKNIVASFETEHNGMGNFYFTPEENKTYEAEVFYNKQKKKIKFAKEIKKFGYVLSLKSEDSDSLYLNITANLFENNDIYNKTIYILAQQNDEIKFKTSKILENNNINISIPKNIFKTGIIQITLFDGKANPAAERLVFINKNDLKNINLDYKSIENKVNLSINLESGLNNEIQNFLSLSIISDSVNLNSDNIISTFLLNNDLRGKVENPNYYFENYNETKQQQLDLVMLTNGWRRYLWIDILNQDISTKKDKKTDTLQFEIEKGITVCGRVEKIYLDLPSKETNVTMTILDKYNDVYKTQTDEKGKFWFKNLYYTDSLDIIIEALNNRNKDNVLIDIYNYDTIPINFEPFIKNENLNLKKKNITKQIYVEKKSNEIHGTADQVIYCDNINSGSYSNVFEFLKSKVPGLSTGNNSANIRNSYSLSPNVSNEPLYLIDNIPTDADAVSSLNMSDVERIEILKSASKSAIYGSRGQNGVIAIYTKKGYNIITGWERMKTIAYYSPKQYLEPKYSLLKVDSTLTTYYWKPDINIKNNEKYEINFSLPNNISKFRIILQGISSEGEIIYKNEIINLN